MFLNWGGKATVFVGVSGIELYLEAPTRGANTVNGDIFVVIERWRELLSNGGSVILGLQHNTHHGVVNSSTTLIWFRRLFCRPRIPEPKCVTGIFGNRQVAEAMFRLGLAIGVVGEGSKPRH